MEVGETTKAEMAKYDTLQKIVDQLEACKYENGAGELKMNVAFLQLKKMAAKQAKLIEAVGNYEKMKAVPATPGEEKLRRSLNDSKAVK